MRYAPVILAAALMLPGCSRTVTTVRTITPAEYGASSWLGHTAAEVTLAWGEHGPGEPDGVGGHVFTYQWLQTSPPPPSQTSPGVPTFAPNLLAGPGGVLPNDVVYAGDLAKFWIGVDGKIYRYWFAKDVYTRHLDAPSARPVERYGRKKP